MPRRAGDFNGKTRSGRLVRVRHTLSALHAAKSRENPNRHLGVEAQIRND
jgi:hypothetical protein